VTPPPEDIVLGVGMAADLGADRELVLREFHPTGHAGFQLGVTLDGGTITAADPRVGFMHRGSEKLFESRDYRQLMMLANRHDWLSAFSSELAIALVLETATGITPPERATWTRMLLAEANRVAATLSFVGAVLDDPDARQAAWAGRERLVTAQEVVTGGRVHPMYTRIGGVAGPIGEPGADAFASAIEGLKAAMPLVTEAVLDHAARLSGLAVLSRDDALGFGTSGPVARASGVDLDVRRDDPYLAYAEIADLLAVPVRTAGDAQARYHVLVEQLPVSAAVMTAAVERLNALGEGPVNVRLPKTVRAPEGLTYGWVEAPVGISGCLLASDGDAVPWRLKIRSASFANAQSLTSALVGVPIEQVGEAVMSFFLVVGDIDR
jgi:NADH-quinone oxidoreductase subunit D